MCGCTCIGKDKLQAEGNAGDSGGYHAVQPLKDMKAPTSCFCSVCTCCYCDMANCWGCQKQGECLCCQEQCHCNCQKPFTCYQTTQQFLCLDCRGAFPCTDDVPFRIACLGKVCAGAPMAEKVDRGGDAGTDMAVKDNKLKT